MQKIIVMKDNIDRVREYLPGDQAEEIEPGCETWSIIYQPGNQSGQVTIWPEVGRAALYRGGDSIWGDYDPQTNTMRADDDNESVYDLTNGDEIAEKDEDDDEDEEEKEV